MTFNMNRLRELLKHRKIISIEIPKTFQFLAQKYRFKIVGELTIEQLNELINEIEKSGLKFVSITAQDEGRLTLIFEEADA